MKKAFTGVWATFTSAEETCATFVELTNSDFKKLTVHSPFPMRNCEHLLPTKKDPIAILAFIGAIFGALISVFFIIWTSLDWILPVSAKPIVSIPVMVPVVFEMTILISFFFIGLGMIGFMAVNAFNHPVPRSLKYKQYDRFSKDRFGIVVPCPKKEIESVKTVFSQHQAEEIEIED